MNSQTPKAEVPEPTQPEKAPKNPQDIVRMNAIDVCISSIRDVRYVEMTDEAKDVVLKNVYNDLVTIYDSLKKSLEA